jgi:glyoxylase-like metal-dependent hydrolase (beta-lactamase superfamily II)
VAGPEPFEIYAVRYGHLERNAAANFIGGDPHDGPMPLDYFVWAITGPGGTFVLDTGFQAEVGARRGREYLADPADGLNSIGVTASEVEDVIISHMHYDHGGNLDMFPKARFHIQDDEMAFATGRHMCHEAINHSFEAADVMTMVARLFQGRVQFHDGDEQIAPGITLHRIGGHTMGLQVMRVWTKRGWVVLASDAAHFYANMEEGRPYPVVFNTAEMLEGFARLRQLASSPDHIIPGHDPMVLQRYPAPTDDLKGMVARLDVEPKAA